MIVLLSPAKKLDFKGTTPTCIHTLPVFLNEAEYLVEELKNLDSYEIEKLMGLSQKLINLNIERYLKWNILHTTENSRQAILAYKGDVYLRLNTSDFTEDDCMNSQNNIRIISGLYGLLRPLDLIQPYRLEMGARFATENARNLYKYWEKKITEELNTAIEQTTGKVLVNLASKEYFQAVLINRLNCRIVTPVFKEYKNDKYQVISIFAKKARGMMARFIIKNRIDQVDDIKAFDMDGYYFNESMSTNAEWVFTR